MTHYEVLSGESSEKPEGNNDSEVLLTSDAKDFQLWALISHSALLSLDGTGGSLRD